MQPNLPTTFWHAEPIAPQTALGIRAFVHLLRCKWQVTCPAPLWLNARSLLYLANISQCLLYLADNSRLT